jgi:hypothetical protein
MVHHSVYAFVDPGRHYVQVANSHGLALPSLPPHYGGTAANPSSYGYDGQFTFYIALHPQGAKQILDVPWYRYQRILEPVVIRILSFGHAILIPWLMLATSWIAVVAGTWAIASWLSARGRHPGWSLLYGLWPGLLVAVRSDLTDALAYGLAAIALLLLDSPTRSRSTLAAAVTALAVFARQEVAIFALMMALGILVGALPQRASPDPPPVRRRLVAALRFGLISVGPFCIYLVLLSHWLHGVPSPISAPVAVPGPEMTADVILLLLPAIAALWAFLPTTLDRGTAHVWGFSTYGVQVLALAGFMIVGRAGVYYSWSFSTVFRYYIPAALAALLCYGTAGQLRRTRSTVLAACFCVPLVALPVLATTGL